MNPIQLLKQDHRTLKGLFRKFEHADRSAEKQRLGQEIIEELSIHAAIEELLIYPLLRRDARHEASVLNALEEHHAVKLILAELDKSSIQNERYEAKMYVVREAVGMHIEEEESKLLPRLEAALEAEERQPLIESMLELKQTLPNHPHPGAPDTPPQGIAALVSRVADSGVDALRSLTQPEKAAGHRRVKRRARASASSNAARQTARGSLRAGRSRAR